MTFRHCQCVTVDDSKSTFIKVLFFSLKLTTRNDKNYNRIIHAYIHWLDDPEKTGQAVHSGSSAPVFTLSAAVDSECARKPPNAHSLGRQTA